MADTRQTPEVDPKTAFDRTGSGDGVILDVREADELEQISIDGALHIPLSELQTRLGDVPQGQDVYVICHVGQRSEMVTDFLRNLGHEQVWNVRGGIITWIKSRLPVRRPGRG